MVTTPVSSRGAHPGWRPASCEEPGWLHRQRRALAGRHAPSRPPWPRPRTAPHPGSWYEGPIARRAGGLEDRGWKGTVPSWPTLIPTALIRPREPSRRGHTVRRSGTRWPRRQKRSLRSSRRPHGCTTASLNRAVHWLNRPGSMPSGLRTWRRRSGPRRRPRGGGPAGCGWRRCGRHRSCAPGGSGPGSRRRPRRSGSSRAATDRQIGVHRLG
jgi:hypothetical protein